ncbi:hypothetical protein CROQUDRAFT_95229 [Cronartium quercuum f. sp. fusiforme G11]|uniref:Uncharacterized protein n=1 Tax=Cronartium quercuum f. sp. fusiforme G11 TaxID=708437 RepID=A0A9P6TA41_9BASI|nr:hypothetical protein CROQUDRAFT_95229 [Cronartium quercuum f. sp. fusiforme G11]
MIRKYKEMIAEKANATIASHIPKTVISTPTQPQSSSNSNDVPSFYDEAFATFSNVDEDIITLDTAATSHMFGNERFLSKITSIVPSLINVASRNGKIYANFKGTVYLGDLKLSGTTSKNYLDKAV